MPTKLGELFCGAGGFASGAKEAGFIHAWGVDNDPDACETIQKNLGFRVLCKSVTEVKYNELEPVGGLVFGFPCNDFSVVGERKGVKGEYGVLYRQAIRALKALQPSFFVAENVPGIMHDPAFPTILSEMRGAGRGYEVHYSCVRMEEYGVPQSRHRVIFMGVHKDIADLRLSLPARRKRVVTAKEALAGIPCTAPNQEAQRHTRKTVERLKYIPPGGNAFSPEVPKEHRLNLKSGAQISQIYRRLDPNRPAYTVTAAGGGGTQGFHWKEHRSLTNRERARLQTFDDKYEFVGAYGSVRRQIGMAVPPLMAEQICKSIARSFRNADIEPHCHA